jgi:hypothetical protein
MTVLANLLSFVIQLLMYEEKWNVLIYITKLFCNLTNHYYSIQILPFTSYAQNI